MKAKVRSIKVKDNIIYSGIYSGLGIIISLLLVRCTLHILGDYDYGVWITLYSIAAWFTFFDIGLAQGLRNKLSESYAIENYSNSKKLISTAYAIIVFTSLILLSLFSLLFPFINWQLVLNATNISNETISLMVFVVISGLIINLSFGIINAILNAIHLVKMTSMLKLLSNCATLFALQFISQQNDQKLLLIALSFSVLPPLTYLVFSIIFFNKNERLKPSIKLIDLKIAKSIYSLGVKFFFLQITAIILFSTDNFIISHIVDPSEVTPYNITLRYFNFIIIIFSVLMSPIWSATTDAYKLNDYVWIDLIKKRFIKTFSFFLCVIILMVIFNQFALKIWLGSDIIDVKLSLVILFGVYSILRIWNMIFTQITYGIGKLDIHLFVAIFIAIINIPLSIFLAKYFGLGSIGVIMATIFCLSIGSILFPIQLRNILSRNSSFLSRV